MHRDVLASAALSLIPRPSVVVGEPLAFHHLSIMDANTGQSTLVVDVHQPVPVPVRVGCPGLPAVLEPVVPALVGLQVPDEVVQEDDLLQF